MASTQPTSFGASITQPAQPDDTLRRSPATLDTPALTPAVSQDSMSAQHQGNLAALRSPFYQHPPASFERVHSRQTSVANQAAFEKDMESGRGSPLLLNEAENPFTNKISIDCNKECNMWPSKQTLVQQKKADKKRRWERQGCAGCAPLRSRWAKLNKRQRLLIKIAIALFVVGVLVAIGVGISVAVNGTYWSSNDGTQKDVGEES